MKVISRIHKLSRRRRVVVAVAAAVAVSLALVLGSGGAHAQDNAPAPGEMPCTPIGQEGPPTIPEDTVVKVGDDYYQCIRGQWWKLPRAMSIGPSGVKTAPRVGTQVTGLNLAR